MCLVGTMANFGKLTGEIRARRDKFKSQLRVFTEKAPQLVNTTSYQAKTAVINATAKFLESVGSQVVRLNRISRATLNRLNAAEKVEMRDRAVAIITKQTKEQLRDTIEAYGRGRINLDSLRTRTQEIIRRGALAATVVGVGGVGNVTENTLVAVQRQLSSQFSFLDGFISELSTRELTQRDRARILQYGNSAHTIAQTARRQFSIDIYGDGELEERRFLGGAEHCEDCVALAAEGWVPFGTLPPIGEGTVCRENCHCTIVVRQANKSDAQSQPVPEG